MPLLIFHAAIAFASLIAPRRVGAAIQRILTGLAIARANARWLAIAASTQPESSGDYSLRDGPTEANRATW